MEHIRRRCGFSTGLSVDCVGLGKEKAGGIALFWIEETQMDIQYYSINLWHFTGLYGFSVEHHKLRTWELINSPSSQIDGKWVCLGDFNDILDNHDKVGGNLKSHTQLDIGRQCVNSCGLTYFGYVGYPYTWTNGRRGDESLQCRLDRVYGIEEFYNRLIISSEGNLLA